MKIQMLILVVLLGISQLFAHRVLLMVDDNADGTITIETGLSSGGTASGAKLIITDRATGRPLWQGTVPTEGVVTTKRPSVPYSVSISMSEGHVTTQAGPELLPLKEAVSDSAVVDSVMSKKTSVDTTKSK